MRYLGVAILLGVLTGEAALAEAGCPCPKSQMIELYGSVSMFPPELPGPRVPQPHVKPLLKMVSTTGLPSMADVAESSLPTPVTDRISNPLLWDPVFVR